MKFKKTTITLITTTLLIIGSLFVSPTLHAETIVIDDEIYVVDGTGTENNIFYIIKNGIKYLMPRWASYNMTSQNLWKKTVASGILTVQMAQTFANLSDTLSGLDDVIDLSMSKVKQGWDSLVDNLDKSTATKKTSIVCKGLLGAVNLHDQFLDGITNLSGAIDNLLSTSKESSLANYYNSYNDIDGVKTYAHGNTSYYSVYNTTTKQFYDTYNNTYETVENYTYNYQDNYYTYNTTNNSYQTTYNYNNTYVFNVGGNYEYELYYKLPNGSNSYNLTYDEINGIRTDFNIDNYQINYSDSSLIGLWHLNGNTNSINDINNSNIFTNDINYFPNNNTQYVDSLAGFDLAYMSIRNKILKFINMENIYNIRFKLYVASNNNEFTLNIFNKSLRLAPNLTYDFEINYLNNVAQLYVNGILNDISLNIYNSSDLPLPSTVVKTNEFSLNNSTTQTTKYSNITIGNWYLNDNGIWDFDISYDRYIYQNGTLSQTKHFNDTYTSVESALYNPSKNTYYSKNYLLDIYTSNNINYFTIDELRLGNTALTNHDVSVLPYTDSYYYTLPDVETNNKILIKSNIPVADFQVGGIRKSNFDAVKGDVYINLVNNTFNSIQQYTGTDWITVDASLYSETLGKWVNAVGYSLELGNFNYIDLEDENDNTNTVIYKLNALFDMVKSKFDTLISSITGTGTTTSDNTITIGDYEIDPQTQIDQELTNLKILSQNIEIDEIIQDTLASDLTNVSRLSSATNGIYDVIEDNGLNLLIIVPIVILILRLVI